MPTSKLSAEYQVLKSAMDRHRARIQVAYEAYEDAKESAMLPTQYGRYTVDLDRDAWRYPAVAEAKRQYESLQGDDGYYWACSRLSDLENLLGLGFSRQVPMGFVLMTMPAHPVVEGFLRAA